MTRTNKNNIKIHRAQFPGKVQGIFFPHWQFYGLKFTSHWRQPIGVWHVTGQVWLDRKKMKKKKKKHNMKCKTNSDSSAACCVCLNAYSSLANPSDCTAASGAHRAPLQRLHPMIPLFNSHSTWQCLWQVDCKDIHIHIYIYLFIYIYIYMYIGQKKPGSLVWGLVSIQIVLCLRNSVDVQERSTPEQR